MKRILFGGIVLGALAGLGCEAEVHPAPVVVGMEYDVQPQYTYYQRGAYVGDDWVWRDQGGRELRFVDARGRDGEEKGLFAGAMARR